MSLRQAIDLVRHLGVARRPRAAATAAPTAGPGILPDTAAVALAEGARALALQEDGRARPDAPWRGFVESADPRHGIAGWVIDTRDPFARPEVELRVGERVVARCAAARHRPDVWRTDDPRVVPGFAFAPEVFHLVNAVAPDEAGAIDVRLAGSGLSLVAKAPLPDRARIGAWIAEAQLDERLFATAGLPLAAALDRLQAVARGRGEQPLRALEASGIGFVEALFPLDAQDVFVSGWTQRAVRHEQPVVLVADGRRHPAALVLVDHPRADLGPGALAFFGLLRCDWRPSSPIDTFLLFLGGDGDAWLRTHRPLALHAREGARERVTLLQAASAEPRLAEFAQRLGERDPWQDTPDAGTACGLHVGIDAVRLLPGFGALVDGWCLSARSSLVGAQLRVGGTLLRMDPASCRLRPRHDLARGFPRLADRLGDAGFAAVFRGELPVEHAGPARLRLAFADGSVLVTPLDAQVLRRLDARIDLAQLAALHPGVEAEAWLDDLAAALRARALQDAPGAVHVRQAVCAEDVLIRLLPDGHELSLALDELATNAAALPPGAALVLVTTPGHPRERVQRWGDALRRQLGDARVGVTQVAEPALAFWLLPEIARRAGARRFTWLGADVMLTAAGWQLAASLPDVDAAAPGFLVVETLRQGRAVAAHDHQAFRWQVDAFADWLARAPFLPGPHAGTHGLPGAQQPGAPGPVHARQLRQRPGGALQARVHDALLRRHAAACAA